MTPPSAGVGADAVAGAGGGAAANSERNPAAGKADHKMGLR